MQFCLQPNSLIWPQSKKNIGCPAREIAITERWVALTATAWFACKMEGVIKRYGRGPHYVYSGYILKSTIDVGVTYDVVNR